MDSDYGGSESTPNALVFRNGEELSERWASTLLRIMRLGIVALF